MPNEWDLCINIPLFYISERGFTMEYSNSYRLLKLKKILFYETDENHELTLKDLQEKLQREIPDRPVDVRTIRRDIHTLESAGFDIVSRKGKYGRNYYRLRTRDFKLYQLRLIVDAILSARFIPNNLKTEIIQQLKKLTSKHHAKTLPKPLMYDSSAEFQNENVKLNIGKIHEAVTNSRVITYQYGQYNLDKEFTFRRDGELYHVEPYGLIWQRDFYYLIGKYQPKNELRHYRLDRIHNIKVTDERFRKERFNLQEYVSRTFNMFAGEEMRIRIQFENELVPHIIDRFGKDIDIRKVDDEHFEISTRAKISKGLISWLLSWGKQAKVISPDFLVKQIKEEVEKMHELYNS